MGRFVIIFLMVTFSIASQHWYEGTPWERWHYDQQRFGDPRSGLIPSDASIRDAELAIRLHTVTKRPALANTLITPIGPFNVAGRTRTIVVDSRSPTVLMTGGVTGGIWKSIDRGLSWVRITSPTFVPHVSCIVQSRTNPDVWYAGTGEGLSTTERRTSTHLRTIGTGTGIYRSFDNGTTWQRITPPISYPPNSLPTAPWQINWRLAVFSEREGEILLAACYGGIYRWQDNQWYVDLGDTTHRSFCTEIISIGDKLYAALGATDEGNRPRHYGIYQRTSGGNWQNITPPNFPTVRRIVLATSSDGSTLYALTQAPRSWTERYRSFASIHTLWRYSVADAQWTNLSSWLERLSNPNQSRYETLGGYAMALAVHPDNRDVVYVAGIDLYSSHDGCRNSAFHLGGYPYTTQLGNLHPDVHAVIFDPHDSSVIYVATDGGIYTTSAPMTQGSIRWQSLANGLLTTQPYHVALHPFRSHDKFVAAGFQDNSTWYTLTSVHGEPWIFGYGGDGCRVIVTNNFIIATSQFGYVYAFTLNRDGSPRLVDLPRPPTSGTIFVTDIAYDYDRELLLLPLGNMLYRLQFNGTSPVSSWNLVITLPEYEQISTLALHDATVLVGTASGNLYRCDIDMKSFERLPLQLPSGSFIASIEWELHNPLRIIVTVSNYTLPSIYATWDGGMTWKSVGGSLDEELYGWGPSVRVVRSLVHNDRRLYIAGTSIGLFVTDTLHAYTGWEPMGLTTVGMLPIEAIEVRPSDGRIVIGTHGGGIYTYTLTGGAADMTPTSTSPSDLVIEHILPHPVHDYAIIRAHVPRSGSILVFELLDGIGRKILEHALPISTAGTVPIVLSPVELACLPDGTYFYRIQWQNRIVTGKLVKCSR